MSLQDISQSLIDTTIDILEARRNPELNPKIGPYTRLKEYADDPSIFISFTEIDKIGINPRSNYNTPLGIYTYPLQAAWENYKVDKTHKKYISSLDDNPSPSDVAKIEHSIISAAFPFATENPYIQVVQAKRPLTDLQDFSKRDLDDTIEQIRQIIQRAVKKGNADTDDKERAITMFEEDLVKKIRKGKATPLVNTPGGLFWWLTMNCSTWKINFPTGKSVVSPVMDIVYKSNSPMRVWNYLLRDLGYDGFIDKGQSIIHTGEPTQAVFLHRKALKKIDKIYNIPSIKSKKKEKLYYWMNDNEISDDAQYTYKERDDSYDWKGGTFISGVWKRGNWEDGLWLDGVWKQGKWHDGIWKYGRFILGQFKGGTWEDGTFGVADDEDDGEGNLVQDVSDKPEFRGDAVWKDGTWLGGIFSGKRWEKGTWKGGQFRKLSAGSANSVWNNGTWEGGTFVDSTWMNGIWEKGGFYDSSWEDGLWKDGTFYASVWGGGIWEKGKFMNSAWTGGLWKFGQFGMNSNFNDQSTEWLAGTWEDGAFLSGEWYDGTWKNGNFNAIWRGGTWEDGFWGDKAEWYGGTWIKGKIPAKKFVFEGQNQFDEFKNHPKVESIKTTSIARKGFLDASEMPIIISRVDPKEFREIEEEVDTLEELLERV